MANETTTITRPAPVIEGSLTAFLKSIDKLGGGARPDSRFRTVPDPTEQQDKYLPVLIHQNTHQRLQQNHSYNKMREPRPVD
jgi:hypothetical protein